MLIKEQQISHYIILASEKLKKTQNNFKQKAKRIHKIYKLNSLIMSKYFKEAAIKVEPSRFSALKIEDDDEDPSFSRSNKTNTKAQTQATSGKSNQTTQNKNKKKKSTQVLYRKL